MLSFTPDLLELLQCSEIAEHIIVCLHPNEIIDLREICTYFHKNVFVAAVHNIVKGFNNAEIGRMHISRRAMLAVFQTAFVSINNGNETSTTNLLLRIIEQNGYYSHPSNSPIIGDMNMTTAKRFISLGRDSQARIQILDNIVDSQLHRDPSKPKQLSISQLFRDELDRYETEDHMFIKFTLRFGHNKRGNKLIRLKCGDKANLILAFVKIYRGYDTGITKQDIGSVLNEFFPDSFDNMLITQYLRRAFETMTFTFDGDMSFSDIYRTEEEVLPVMYWMRRMSDKYWKGGHIHLLDVFNDRLIDKIRANTLTYDRYRQKHVNNKIALQEINATIDAINKLEDSIGDKLTNKRRGKILEDVSKFCVENL